MQYMDIPWGDEGQALGESYMAFQFQPDLCPWLSNAGVILNLTYLEYFFPLVQSQNIPKNMGNSKTYPRSRFLITTIPSSMYVWNEDGVNVTLQAAAEIITESMNRLSTTGITVPGENDEVFWQWLSKFCFQSQTP